MRQVARPSNDAGETFATCISRVRNPELKTRLSGVRPDIEVAAADYAQNAATNGLHEILQIPMVGGAVTTDEMVRTYDQRMAKKAGPGRLIYDQIKILPPDDKCPFCGQRNVSTLDHVLPKSLYPVFAVTPDNLVGSCIECNNAKKTTVPHNASDTILHPYFDSANDYQWLRGEIVEQNPCAITFSVKPIHEWNDELNARIANQFGILELGQLYSSQAAEELTNIRHNLQIHHNARGHVGVRAELTNQWASRRAHRLNSWQTATYEAMKNSDWFCMGGFT